MATAGAFKEVFRGRQTLTGVLEDWSGKIRLVEEERGHSKKGSTLSKGDGGKHGVTRDKARAGPPERPEEGVTLSKQGEARASGL